MAWRKVRFHEQAFMLDAASGMYSHQMLADMYGISVSLVDKILSGKRRPGLGERIEAVRRAAACQAEERLMGIMHKSLDSVEQIFDAAPSARTVPAARLVLNRVLGLPRRDHPLDDVHVQEQIERLADVRGRQRFEGLWGKLSNASRAGILADVGAEDPFVDSDLEGLEGLDEAIAAVKAEQAGQAGQRPGEPACSSEPAAQAAGGPEPAGQPPAHPVCSSEPAAQAAGGAPRGPERLAGGANHRNGAIYDNSSPKGAPAPLVRQRRHSGGDEAAEGAHSVHIPGPACQGAGVPGASAKPAAGQEPDPLAVLAVRLAGGPEGPSEWPVRRVAPSLDRVAEDASACMLTPEQLIPPSHRIWEMPPMPGSECGNGGSHAYRTTPPHNLTAAQHHHIQHCLKSAARQKEADAAGAAADQTKPPPACAAGKSSGSGQQAAHGQDLAAGCGQAGARAAAEAAPVAAPGGSRKRRPASAAAGPAGGSSKALRRTRNGRHAKAAARGGRPAKVTARHGRRPAVVPVEEGPSVLALSGARRPARQGPALAAGPATSAESVLGPPRERLAAKPGL